MGESYPIVLENVTFTYEGFKEPSLKNVCLKIRRGEVTAILGRTGAGKTTMVYVMGGVIPNYVRGKLEGDIIVEGMNTKEYRLYELARHVGIVMDDPEAHIVSFTVWEDAAFGPSNLGLPRDEILKRVEFSLKATRLEGLRNRNPYNLSGGEKQSLAIAGALSMRPSVLVLDEPTSMLDPLGSSRVLTVLKELNRRYGVTIVLSDFNAERVVSLADRVVVIDKGEIVMDGDCKDVLQDIEALEKVGVRVPDVTKLSSMLMDKGLWSGRAALEVEEAVKGLSEILRRARTGKSKTERGVEAGKHSSPASRPMIEVRNLSHTYPGGVKALKNINLEIRRGEFVAIIGQNGSGKTTLAKYLCGLLKPVGRRGKVVVDGLDLSKAGMRDIIRKVGYVFQIPEQQIFFTTVREEIGFGLKNLGLPEEHVARRIEEVIRRLKIEDYRNSLIESLDRGKKFRVVLGSIIAMDPEVIVVDEPTTGQDWNDSVYICSILEELRRGGKTILMITHEMSLVARFATRVIVMCDGELLMDGSPREVFSKPNVLKKTWVQPPQITRLSQALSEYGVKANALTVEEMYRYIMEILGEDVHGSARVRG